VRCIESREKQFRKFGSEVFKTSFLICLLLAGKNIKKNVETNERKEKKEKKRRQKRNKRRIKRE
jgi:hypothetical protein